MSDFWSGALPAFGVVAGVVITELVNAQRERRHMRREDTLRFIRDRGEAYVGFIQSSMALRSEAREIELLRVNIRRNAEIVRVMEESAETAISAEESARLHGLKFDNEMFQRELRERWMTQREDFTQHRRNHAIIHMLAPDLIQKCVDAINVFLPIEKSEDAFPLPSEEEFQRLLSELSRLAQADLTDVGRRRRPTDETAALANGT
jgi:hypothetical protein